MQAKDDDDMRNWVSALNSATEGAGPASRAQTLPAGVQDKASEPKKRGFFTLKHTYVYTNVI